MTPFSTATLCQQKKNILLGLYRLGHENSFVSIGPCFSGIPCHHHKNRQIEWDYNESNRELKLNFLCIMYFMLRWPSLTVTAVIPIVWLNFSKICLPHPSTRVSLVFCWFAKFSPKQKTWFCSRKRPAMTDFHREVHVNKFWQRFSKCDPYLHVHM